VPTNRVNRLTEHLYRSVLYNGAGSTDGQLLDSFIQRKDTAALAALVRRHGPMVWGVCSRMLRSHQDAEDAFQASSSRRRRPSPTGRWSATGFTGWPVRRR
jgi:hypothetical protein